MGSSATKRLLLALCLCLAGAAVSGVLLLQHHGERTAVSAVNELCGDGQTSGCEEVARSAWSSFAGLPLAAYGLVFYLALSLALAFALLASDDLRDTLGGAVALALVAGVLVDLFLFGVQAFRIHAFCRLCLLTYALGAVALFVLFKSLRGAVHVGAALGRPEGRLVAGALAFSTLAVAAAVVTGDHVLAYRAARRQANLLGAPAAASATTSHAITGAAATPTPAAAAPAPEATPVSAPPAVVAPPTPAPSDAAAWRERAQKLQETLDDPRKLEEYFSAKAQREYDSATPAAIDLSSAPLRGPATAPAQVVEYSDFLCPFCRNLALGLNQFLASPQAGGRLAVYFKSYPLDADCNPKLKQSTHPGACHVALGGVCAQLQGKFEAYHDRVFSTELHNPQPADVVRLAGEAGLNAAALQGCLDDPKTREILQAQIAEGNRLGVSSTPTIYVNGKKLPRVNDFLAVIDKEARKKGFPPMGQ